MVRIETFAKRYVDGVVALCAAQGWPAWTPEKVERALSAPGVLALVAIEDSDVVGVAELLTDGDVIAYLGLLIVSAQVRRRGIGRELVNELFVRSGCSRMDVLADAATGSSGFYESLPHKVKAGYRLYDS